MLKEASCPFSCLVGWKVLNHCCELTVLEVSFQSFFHSTALNYWIQMDVYSLFILKAQFNTYSWDIQPLRQIHLPFFLIYGQLLFQISDNINWKPELYCISNFFDLLFNTCVGKKEKEVGGTGQMMGTFKHLLHFQNSIPGKTLKCHSCCPFACMIISPAVSKCCKTILWPVTENILT